MALVICPECGKEVSSNAKACPHCGQPFKTSGGCLNVCFGIAAGLFAVYVIVVVGNSLSPSRHDTSPQSQPSQPTAVEAWTVMKLHVEELLGAKPAKFKFGAVVEDVQTIRVGHYVVNSHVDTENDFGGKVRLHFSGTVRKTDDGWRIEDFKIVNRNSN